MQGADMDNGPNNMYGDEDEYGQEGQDVPDNNNALVSLIKPQKTH